MKKFWTQTALAAASLLSVGAANAYVIDFENVDTSNVTYASGPNAGSGTVLVDADYITQGGYFVQGQDYFNTTYGTPGFTPSGALVASLTSAADGSCLDGSCPTGSTGTFMTVLDDSLLHFGKLSGAGTTLSSFDAAYVPSAAAPAGSTVYLAIEADRSDGSYAQYVYLLPSVTASGTTSFAHFTAANGILNSGSGTLTSGNVTDLYAYAFYCNPSSGSCTGFNSDKGQFAIDNIALDVSAVPEPSEWMLMALGLGAVGTIVRRRRSA